MDFRETITLSRESYDELIKENERLKIENNNLNEKLKEDTHGELIKYINLLQDNIIDYYLDINNYYFRSENCNLNQLLDYRSYPFDVIYSELNEKYGIEHTRVQDKIHQKYNEINKIDGRY